MAKNTTVEVYSQFTAQIVNSNRSKLGKRGITGGVLVDVTKIPASVINVLLIDAIQAHLQVGLKTIDQDSATTEQCQEAMKARLELLYNGKTSGPGATRKAPTRDVVTAEAKKIIKKSFQDQSEEKLDARTLTTIVNDMFKMAKEWEKAGSDPNAKAAGVAKIVNNAIATAKAAQEEAKQLAETLAPLAARAAQLSAEAKAKREAEAAEAAETMEGEDEKVEAKPTPTQKVNAQKAAAKKKPAAR